jgi:hypothetical protein
MAKMPPLPPAGRAPLGGKNADGGRTNPKDIRAASGTGHGKQAGVSKATQSNRNFGSR